jgi:hypothetical protein
LSLAQQQVVDSRGEHLQVSKEYGKTMNADE